MDYDKILANFTKQAEEYANVASSFVNSGVEQISQAVSEKLQDKPWVPEWALPRKPPPPPPPPPIILPLSRLGRAQDWVVRNKLLLCIVLASAGYAGYKIYNKSMLLSKSRRARRAPTGGRCEVVVIAGSPSLPLTRALALELERKGFVVFITCTTVEEETMVKNLSRSDIRAISVDLQNPAKCSASIDRFADFLRIPHSAVPKVKPHYLNLSAFFVIPSLTSEISPLSSLPRTAIPDLLGTNLVTSIRMLQAFLPLLTSGINPYSWSHPPKILVFVPSIVTHLRLAYHAPETTVCSALLAVTDVLAAELQPLHITVHKFELGVLDFTTFSPALARSGAPLRASTGFLSHSMLSAVHALRNDEVDTLPWSEGEVKAHGKNYIAVSQSGVATAFATRFRPTSLQELHDAVFDVVDDSNSASVVRVGLGASTYAWVGAWIPRTLVSMMMGMRPVTELHPWKGLKISKMVDFAEHARKNIAERSCHTEADRESEDESEEEDDVDDEDEGSAQGHRRNEAHEDDDSMMGSAFINVDGEHNKNVWVDGSVVG